MKLAYKTFAGILFCAVAPFTAGRLAAFDCDGVDPVPGDALRLKVVTTALIRPVDAAAPAGDTGRLFVVEQRGTIRIIDLSNDSRLPDAFLDIQDRVNDGSNEMGLLGLAFHPDYAANGFFYVNYTADRRPNTSNAGLTRVSRFQVSGANPNQADATSEKILLSFDQPYSNHNGGQVLFGPKDGNLYIFTGDGGSGGDPQNRAQNPLSFLGKILRLDVDSGDPYGIPSSNPFAGRANVLPEIWALGLRNPWRNCFDPVTGDLYIGDVGQDSREEVDFQPGSSAGGENYEWKVREGDNTFSGASFSIGSRVAPVYDYGHSGPVGSVTGRSVTGGIVYRGCSMPDLHGTYFFADYASNWVRTFRMENGQAVNLRDRTSELNQSIVPSRMTSISSFGTDGRGEIYICSLSGTIYRLLPATPPPPKKFRRGDSNADQAIEVADALVTLGYLFLHDPQTVLCQDALDANDDGGLDIADPVFTLIHLFKTQAPLPPPSPDCGPDPTTAGEALGCQSSTCS